MLGTSPISTRGNTFKNTVVADETKGVESERLVCLPSQTCLNINTKPTLRKYLGCGTDSFQEARSFRLDGKLDGSQLVKSPISTFYEFCHPFLYTSACQFPWVYVIGIQVSGEGMLSDALSPTIFGLWIDHLFAGLCSP